MNEFRRASVDELAQMIRLIDTKAINSINLAFLLDWTEPTSPYNDKYSPKAIIFFLESLGDR